MFLKIWNDLIEPLCGMIYSITKRIIFVVFFFPAFFFGFPLWLLTGLSVITLVDKLENWSNG